GLEIARDPRADHVRTRRQELAELDVRGTQASKRGRQAIGRYAARRSFDEPRHANRSARRQREARGVDQPEHAFAGQYESGAGKAGEVGRTRDHKRQPECKATIPPDMRVNETRAKPASRSSAANAFGDGKRRIDSTR